MSLQLTSGSGGRTFHEAALRLNLEFENLTLLSYSYSITGISKPADKVECTKQIALKIICKSYYTRSLMQKKKTEIVTARMTPADKKAIRQRAKAAGMTVTDYLTTCALGKEIIRVEGLDDLLSELKAQGRNLNQLTTLANMGRITVLRGDDLTNEYTRLCDLLSELVREGR